MLPEEKELRAYMREVFPVDKVYSPSDTDYKDSLRLITALVRAVREDDAKAAEECKVRFSGRINNRVHVDEVAAAIRGKK